MQEHEHADREIGGLSMLAIRNVRLIDGSGRNPVNKTNILIHDGRFIEIGSEVAIPDDCYVIEGKGLTAVPGFIDIHTHFGGSPDPDCSVCGNRQDTCDYKSAREGFLHWGITTVRSCGDQTDDILGFRDNVNTGKLLSPRLKVCGPFFQHPEGHPWNTVYFKNEVMKETAVVFVDEGASIEEQVDAIAAKGVDFIKVIYGHVNVVEYPNTAPRITERHLKRVIDRAHRNGLKCACHVDGPQEMAAAAKAGADTIEHMVNVGNTEEIAYTREIIAAVKENGSVVTPTLVEVYHNQQPFFKEVREQAREGVIRLYEAGVPLAVGCDSGIPFVPFGESLHKELEYLVDAGIPAAEVLRMATLGNARILGMDDMIGSIETGKEADLVLLGSDPLKDISGTKDIRMVIIKGQIVRDERK